MVRMPQPAARAIMACSRARLLLAPLQKTIREAKNILCGLVSDSMSPARPKYNIIIIRLFGIVFSSQRMVKFKQANMIDYFLRICSCSAEAGRI